MSTVTVPSKFPGPVRYRTGYNNQISAKEIYPGENGIITVETRETDRLEINLAGQHLEGYHVIGNRLRPLPIGSYLAQRQGVFYWQPGPGFYGTYDLLFINRVKHGNQQQKTWIRVKISSPGQGKD